MQLAEGYQLKNIIEGCVEIEQLVKLLSEYWGLGWIAFASSPSTFKIYSKSLSQTKIPCPHFVEPKKNSGSCRSGHKDKTRSNPIRDHRCDMNANLPQGGGGQASLGKVSC